MDHILSMFQNLMCRNVSCPPISLCCTWKNFSFFWCCNRLLWRGKEILPFICCAEVGNTLRTVVIHIITRFHHFHIFFSCQEQLFAAHIKVRNLATWLLDLFLIKSGSIPSISWVKQWLISVLYTLIIHFEKQKDYIFGSF